MAYAGPTVRSETSWSQDGSPSTNHNIPYPATIVEGDRLVLFIFHSESGIPNEVAGWDRLVINGTSGGVTAFLKAADGTETGSLAVVTPASCYAAYKAYSVQIPNGLGGTIVVESGNNGNQYFSDTTAGTTLTQPAQTPVDVDDLLCFGAILSLDGATWNSVGGSWSGDAYAGPTSRSSVVVTQEIEAATSQPIATHTYGAATTGRGHAFAISDTTLGPVWKSNGSIYETSSAGVTSHPVPYPSTVDAQDWLILLVQSDDENQTFTVPTGWGLLIEFDTSASHGVAGAVMGRVADGTETGTVTLTTNAGGYVGAVIVRYSKGGSVSGAPSATYFAADYIDYTTTQISPNPPSVAVALGDWMAIEFLVFAQSTNSSDQSAGYKVIYNDRPGLSGTSFGWAADKVVRNNTVVNPDVMTLTTASTGVVYTVAFTTGLALAQEDEVFPEEDVEVVFWDTYPTGSQPLWEQVSETTPNDSTYIYATDPNP